MPDAQAAAEVQNQAEQAMKELDSVGGIIECVITGMKPGIGDPVFDKLSAQLGKAVLSIGAVKGFELGDGFKVAASRGSENNDEFSMKDGKIIKTTNHSGGVLGGISDGSPIIFRAAVKPTPSIARMQNTVSKDKQDVEIKIRGRHDPMIVPRAVVVVESMAAITILDSMLRSMGSTLENVKKLYE